MAWKMKPFGANEIKPAGWLMQQLKIQAKGLCGHLDKVWPDIRDSRWIGGNRDGWERVPYWLDGFIPLAWLLNDEDMKARAKRYIDGILEGQQPDGWICPCTMEERARYDLWAYLLIAKVLTVYADCSGDGRVAPALERALACLNLHMERHTLFDWGAARWYEGLIAVSWLHERLGAEWLMDLAQKLMVQGFDYHAYFDGFRDKEPVRRWSQLTHIVNLSMSMRQDALAARLFGGDGGLLARKALDVLTKYHGMANGHFTGDECLSGTSPIQGTELCGVVEAMFSYENLLAATAEPQWGDMLEKLAFNALPATVSEDMWTHQYVQMSNQVRCEAMPEHSAVFRTNGPESHLFGLEPNFGCCTANFGQGWPKLALSTFMQTPDGIAATVLAPSQLQTQWNGCGVQCALDTQYPFRGTLRFRVKTDRPVAFTLSIRIPGFAASAEVNGEPAQPGGFHHIHREWRDEQVVDVSLRFEPQLTARPSEMRTLWNGPLLYALPVKEHWERREYVRDGVERKFPYCDYEVTPMSRWAYGFAGEDFEAREHELTAVPFSASAPPIGLMGKMVPIEWNEQNGACTARPAGTVPAGQPERIELIPYGCARLRMTEMPTL